MHTLSQSTRNKSEWFVGRIQPALAGGSEFVPLFKGLQLSNALKLVSMLNGATTKLEADEAQVLEYLVTPYAIPMP